MNKSPDFECLFGIASEQHGHFTRAQAETCGYRTNLLTYLTRSGQFNRVHRGVYRLRDYPSYPREEVIAAWLAVGKDVAVVSHESALDLLGLSDIIPNAVHLTVPRSMRNLPKLPGVRIHTSTRKFEQSEVVSRDGMRITSAARTIVDAADWGTGSEQIETATRQALQQGTTSRRSLETAAAMRSSRVQVLINRAIKLASE